MYMLKVHHFLQLVPQRIQTALTRIQGEIWYDRREIPVSWTGKVYSEHVTWDEASRHPVKKVDAPFFWGKLFDQTWFRIDIPLEYQDDDQWYLDWREQGESTAYIDGVPFAGLDIAHLNARLPRGTREVWMESMCLETGIWTTTGLPPINRRSLTEEGCRFEKATLVRRNDDAWHAYHDLHVLQGLIEIEHGKHFPDQGKPRVGAGMMNPLLRVEPRYRQLLRMVDDALSVLEQDGIKAFRKATATIYDKLREGTMPLHCVLTGHAHMDLVWLWPERCSESKAVHTFATANRLMDEYPEMRFGYSQPASYRAVGKRSPRLMQRVKQRIAEGRWDAVGGMEVESDTQIACGEALVRSLLLGQEGFVELNGEPSKIVWLPDVFGYSSCLPQMMVQTGIRYFYTTKLTWGNISHFPYSTFIWRGPDGSEITSHISQGFSYSQVWTPDQAYTAAVEHRQSDIHDQVLAPIGYGDGGGGVTEDMCERVRRMATLSGLPTMGWGNLNDFFAHIDTIQDRLPVFSGELYLQYHRGVLTTHGNLKLAMRVAERSLQAWEAVHCVTGLGEIDKESWRRVVFAQFHDYIPGSSIREVYEEALPELDTIARHAQQKSEEILGQEHKGGTLALFNPLPVARKWIHEERVYQIGALEGTPVDSLTVVDCPSVTATATQMDNGRVRVGFDSKGRILALNVDGRNVAIDGRLGDLVVYPANPHMHDAWELDCQTLTLGNLVESDATVLVEGSQSVRAIVSFTKKLTAQSSVTIHYILEAGSPVLRVNYDVDWNDKKTYLRVLFPTHYRGKEVRFGTPYGSILRSQARGLPYDEAQWEVAGSRWAIISDDGEKDGLGVITEAKYGWSAKDGSLQLSLLHSAVVTHNETHSALRKPNTMPFADLGKSTIRLAIGHFTSDILREESAPVLADTLFTDPILYRGGACRAGLRNIRGGQSLVPAWAKPVCEGEWILRMHETLGQRGTVTLDMDEGWSVTQTDLSEASDQPLNGYTLSFTPYQLVSIRVKKIRNE
jgi:alpha-mannosidase